MTCHQANQKVENFNFMGLFCLKGTLIQPKTEEFHLVTLKGHGKFEEKLTLGFQFSPGKTLLILLKRVRRVKISNFMTFLSKKYIDSIKNCGRSLNL